MEHSMVPVVNSERAKFIVPSHLSISGLQSVHAHAHETHFLESRERLLNAIRSVPGFVAAVAKMAPNGLYQLLPGPAGAWVIRDASGATQAVWRNTDGIAKHGRLLESGPNLMGTLTAIASQVLLVKIAVDIQEVIRQNSEISQSLHDDRIALVVAGAAMLDQALHASSPSMRQNLLCNATQSLNEGIHRCCREMNAELANAPSTNDFGDNWWKSNVKKAKERFQKAKECLHASILGSQCLAEAYALLGESQAGTHAMSSTVELILRSGISEGCAKARFLAPINGVFPEDEWKLVRSEGEKWLEQIRKFEHTLGEPESLVIEVDSNDLVGAK
jgi:hypothetical protein